MNILLAILAATVMTAPKGKIYNDAPVVTNVTFEGLAFETNIVANYLPKVGSLGLEGSILDWDGRYLKCRYFEKDTVDYNFSEMVLTPSEASWKSDYAIGINSADFLGFWIGDKELGKDGSYRYGKGFVFQKVNGNYYQIKIPAKSGTFAVLSDIPATADDIGAASADALAEVEKTIVPAPAITNIARSVVNSVWDDALGVAWEARMHDGALYYIAVTNRQEVAE